VAAAGSIEDLVLTQKSNRASGAAAA